VAGVVDGAGSGVAGLERSARFSGGRFGGDLPARGFQRHRASSAHNSPQPALRHLLPTHARPTDYTPCGLIREADARIERIAENVAMEALGELAWLRSRSGAHDKLVRSLVVSALNRARVRLQGGDG
jgi:hypothetical protein